MKRWTSALAAALLLAAAMPLAAQSGFPSKPIHVVVPSPPGGPPDLIMRMLAPKLGAALGQPVVVENRPGAGGIVGTAYVAKQPADGYTWLFTTASHTNIPPFNENVPYDPVKDFTHVTLAAQNFGQALIVNRDVPARNVQELIALARKQPGKLTYGSAGIGTASHIPAEVMKAVTGTDILLVPYRGVAEAMTDLIAGRIDMFFVGTQIALQHVQSGAVRALAVTGSKRWKGMPDVPTMQEAGIKDFDVINWFGLWLPAGAPHDIVDRIQGEVEKALAEPDVRQQFETLGLEGVGSKPDDFARFVAKEAQVTRDIARRIGAKPVAAPK
jgi:tripartite-type tricarboxylate transporter receptor subunit TctC